MKVLKNIVKGILDKAGYDVMAKSLRQPDENGMQGGLERLAALNIHPNTVIDIGAAQGFWTEKALNVWPKANFELVEPLKEQQPKLSDLKSAHPNINYHLAVAGEQTGEILLNVSDDLDGSGIYGEADNNARRVPVTTVDEIMKNKKGPLLIKLDTHGYEAAIIKGAASSLAVTEAWIIEVYGFHISPTCLLFHELTAHLDNLGFRLFDIVDVMRRKTDSAFWQADAFYLRKDNPVFRSNSYQ